MANTSSLNLLNDTFNLGSARKIDLLSSNINHISHGYAAVLYIVVVKLTTLTCSETLSNCCGHFGQYKLALPVFHLGFFRQTYTICQSICKHCSRVLIDPLKKLKYLQTIKTVSDLGQKRLFTKFTKECKKISTCFYCRKHNGKVRKAPGLKIFLEASDMKEDLNPLKSLNFFRCIPKDEYVLLGIYQSPADIISQKLVIPPAPIRPSVAMEQEGGSNEDDLTIKIREIIHCNQILVNSIQRGNPYSVILEDWDFIQNQYAQLISPYGTGKQLKGLLQRLKGKHGRFRGNLNGKRVDFSSRTGISPDPNLGVDEVGVSRHIAKILTIPERVAGFNIERLRKLIRNGVNYPGANYVIKPCYSTADQLTVDDSLGELTVEQSTANESLQGLANDVLKEVASSALKEATNNNLTAGQLADGKLEEGQLANRKQEKHVRRKERKRGQEIKMFLKYCNRTQTSKYLRIGDIVERHLQDGDIVLFNRQPSIHRMSIMAHRAKVYSEKKTFKFNECCCTPNNADFDGDEMNVHVLQTYESRAEAIELMCVKSNLVNPKNGEPLIAAIQDFVTASYLLTSRNTFFSYETFSQYASDLEIKIEAKPLIEALLKEVVEVGYESGVGSGACINSANTEAVTLISKNRSYKQDWNINHGYVVVIQNKYFIGRLDKSVIGTENKETSLLYRLIKKNMTSALNFLNKLSRLSSRYLCDSGFSIGLGDVNMKKEDYKSKKLELESGCKLEEMHESNISSTLHKIRESCGNLCLNELSINNSPIIMQSCGSKGSKINVSQMVACVGQQIISGKRVPNGFCRRTLPHFAVDSKFPRDKGFVASSFKCELSSTEFFFHAISGREGLFDTAVKTAETGYMQRRLMKALEDLSVMYVYTVRGSDKSIVQYVYGEKCVDLCLVEWEDNIRRDVVCEELLALRDIFSTHKEKIKSALMSTYKSKLNTLKIEPGSAVGALAGQSIGEPGTQMTLKTFHFAGVASMNITLGVPRRKEIINAVKNINTPIIKTNFVKNWCLQEAKRVKGRIDKIYLKDIVSSMTEIYTQKELFLEVEICSETISSLKLEINLEQIKRKINCESFIDNNKITFYLKKEEGKNLRNIVVSKIKSVERVILVKEKDYKLFVEGTGLKQIFGVEGVDYRRTVTNNIMEMERLLGIEAAREAIIREMQYTISSHEIKIDPRHLMLLADAMVCKGEVLGITRFGISKMKFSTLILASFEQTGDHLFEAAIRNRKDAIKGVSESIIIGAPISMGTGSVEQFYKEEQKNRRAPQLHKMKILNVAEKPSVAKSISYILNANYQLVRSNYKEADFVFTSVLGHLYTTDFLSKQRWEEVDPELLFEEKIVKFVKEDFLKLKENTERNVSLAGLLIIWTACDREGENIAKQIAKVALSVKNIEIKRARLFGINKREIDEALSSLVDMNELEADAVDVKMELDLKIGSTFTRLQTLSLKREVSLPVKVVSYGSCQTPTLGFVVDRSKYPAVVVCREDRPVEKFRPLPLWTDELQKTYASYFKMSAHRLMEIAEPFSTISYPRKETDSFSKTFKFKSILNELEKDEKVGEYASALTNSFKYPRSGKNNDMAHLPIYLLKNGNSLSGDNRKLFEFVSRIYLACISDNARGIETKVVLKIRAESFILTGLRKIDKNYLEVYFYDKWENKAVSDFQLNETFKTYELKIVDGTTTPPDYLTEAELIALMDKNGIGTDATLHEHIQKIQDRNYVNKYNSKIVPLPLGRALIKGYEVYGLEFSKPRLRSELEMSLKKIEKEEVRKEEVVEQQVEVYRDIFRVMKGRIKDFTDIFRDLGSDARPDRGRKLLIVPKRQREAVIFHNQSGLPASRISKLTKTPGSTAYSIIWRYNGLGSAADRQIRKFYCTCVLLVAVEVVLNIFTSYLYHLSDVRPLPKALQSLCRVLARLTCMAEPHFSPSPLTQAGEKIDGNERNGVDLRRHSWNTAVESLRMESVK
ncbi:unnamed protein product, partial [Darwinula stevensoni]